MTLPLYPVFETSAWKNLGFEEMGSKPKFWLKDHTQTKWLFKHRHRPLVGDDWAEKIAAEVAKTLGIPHAVVELAVFQGQIGIISKDLIVSKKQELVLGNSLLFEVDPTYPQADRYHVAAHTLDRVLMAIEASYIGLPEEWPAHPAIRTAPDLFLGYLMLDALIGNTDRHHENWAIIQYQPLAEQRRATLCPTFDHASSLGHLLTDDERSKRLSTRDQGYSIASYVRRGRSALYRKEGDAQPMTLFEAFQAGTALRPEAGQFWLRQLQALEPAIIKQTIEKVPGDRMTGPAREFAAAMMCINQTRLLMGKD